MGTSYTALSGSRGMVASLSPQSSARKLHESTLPGLDEGTREGTPLNVDLRRGLAVDLDPALGDQAPGLARRADAEVLDQEGREVDRIAGRQLHLGDLFRRPMVADDTREVILAPRRAFLPMPPRDDPAGELALPLHRVGPMTLAARAHLSSLLQRRIRSWRRLV